MLHMGCSRDGRERVEGCSVVEGALAVVVRVWTRMQSEERAMVEGVGTGY